MGTATAGDQAYGDYAPGIKVRDEEDPLGLPGGTRTPDLLLRRQLLYPVELRAERGLRARLEMVGVR